MVELKHTPPFNLNLAIMNTPQYQFNLGYDPLLTGNGPGVDYISQIDNQIQQLNIIKNRYTNNLNNAQNQNVQNDNGIDIWNEIDKEVNSMNADQQNILGKDEIYVAINNDLQALVQQELIDSVKYKVANSPRGKELLEKHLNNIRSKKNAIVEASNKELELFKQFQIAAKANPQLTYVEFCKTINNN